MKSLHLILVLFSIASMFTSFGVYDVDATKEDNNGKSWGCEKGTATNNPHCKDGGGTSPTQFTACDSNWNGYIDNMELAAYASSVTETNYSNADAASWIIIADADNALTDIIISEEVSEPILDYSSIVDDSEDTATGDPTVTVSNTLNIEASNT